MCVRSFCTCTRERKKWLSVQETHACWDQCVCKQGSGFHNSILMCPFFFDGLLTVHLSIILVISQLNAQNLVL